MIIRMATSRRACSTRAGEASVGRGSRTFSGRVQDGGDESGGVVVIESGDGVAEVNRDACREACRELENTPLTAGAGEPAAGEYDRCVVAGRPAACRSLRNSETGSTRPPAGSLR